MVDFRTIFIRFRPTRGFNAWIGNRSPASTRTRSPEEEDFERRQAAAPIVEAMLVAILRAMSRPAAFQRSMARLALMAMLALTLLPGIGRLSAHAAIAGFDGISSGISGAAASGNALAQSFGAMCTTQGLAYDPSVAAIEAIGFSTRTDDDGRSPAPAHAGNDCDYCTIASVSNVPASTALVAAALPRDIALPPRRDRVALWHYPLGLGSRGPPPTA